MKKFLALILVLMLALTMWVGCGDEGTGETEGTIGTGEVTEPANETPETTEETAVVTVGAVDEFMEAIADDVVIELEPGVYNVTEWLLGICDSVDSEKQLVDTYGYAWADNVREGIYLSYVFDGYEAVIYRVSNLTIRSEDPENPAEIVCEPRYAQVLYFDGCEDIKLENVIVGHTKEKGECLGNVLYFDACTYVDITGCDLYGCGTYGVASNVSFNINADDTTIHDCSYGGVDLTSSRDINFTNCQFKNTGDYACVKLSNESEVYFKDCTFDNVTYLTGYDDDCRAEFENCTMDGCEITEYGVYEFAD